ncbi:hypothetical protein R6Z07M_013733 [Ovis aries]
MLHSRNPRSEEGGGRPPGARPARPARGEDDRPPTWVPEGRSAPRRRGGARRRPRSWARRGSGDGRRALASTRRGARPALGRGHRDAPRPATPSADRGQLRAAQRAGRAGKRDAPGRGPGIGSRTDGRRGAPTAQAVGPGATGNHPDAVARRPPRALSARGLSTGRGRSRGAQDAGPGPLAGPARPHPQRRGGPGEGSPAASPRPHGPRATRRAQLPASGPEGPPPGDDTLGPGQRRSAGGHPGRAAGRRAASAAGPGPERATRPGRQDSKRGPHRHTRGRSRDAGHPPRAPAPRPRRPARVPRAAACSGGARTPSRQIGPHRVRPRGSHLPEDFC